MSGQDTQKYGIVSPGVEKGQMVEAKSLVEKPQPGTSPSNLAIVGRYILQPQVFDALSEFNHGAGGEIQLTDAMASMIDNQPFHGFRFEGQRYDCGSRLGFIEANIVLGMKDPNLGEEITNIVRKAASNI